MDFILKQLERAPRTFLMRGTYTKELFSYKKLFLLDAADNNAKKAEIDFEVNILCHFSFCIGMHNFSTGFHKL
jgi:hypothetical protein